MLITSIANFVNAVRQSRLLSPNRFDEFAGSLAEQSTDARELARVLLNRDWLTAYQINQLFQGNGGQLVLGSYRLLERLGEGGMGKVFKAWHRKLDRIVALKLLHKEYLQRPDALQRFYQEIQVVARLAHPNIVFAFDADQAGDTHFLAMEYVDGIGLAQLVGQLGTLPAEQACEYIRQAALGMQHAHERGLVHRDIKPSNLLVTRSVPSDFPETAAAAFGTVKIIDFGLARLDSGEPLSARRLTRIGTVMGTPDFLAPEQASSSKNADIRSDLYSLGCTFYYLLTGRLPFPRGGVMDKIRQHEKVQPIRVERLNPTVPAALGAVVRKLMAKKPEQRFQTPAELAEAMESFLGTAGTLAPALRRHFDQRDVLANLNLPGFFGPGIGSLSSTTIFTSTFK